MKKTMLVCLSLILLALSVGCVLTANATTGVDFDKTNVLDDLNSLDGFNAQQYTAYNTVRLVYFAEYCYAYNISKNGNYGLYLYIYNGTGSAIDTNSVLNKAQLASAYKTDGSPATYSKFDLKFLNADGKFLKYKVKDTSGILQTAYQYELTHNVRRYDISGIELLTTGKPNATDYKVGGTFKYAGYAEGYGRNSTDADTLTCEASQLETLELGVQGTYYRFNNYDSQLFKSSQLNSVYFSVPKAVIDDYGNMQSVKATWYEYKTTPIVVTSDNKVYDSIKNVLGKDLQNLDLNWGLFGGYLMSDILNLPYINYYYYWSYNNFNTALTNRYSYSNCNKLSYLFKVSNLNEMVQSETLLQWIRSGKYSDADLFESYVDEGRTRGENVVEIDAGDTYDLQSSSLSSSWWQKLFGQTYFTQNTSAKAIVQITENDLLGTDQQVGENLFVATEHVPALKAYYNNNKESRYTYLLHFAETPYISMGAEWIEKGLFPSTSSNVYIAMQYLFEHFDIIELKLRSDSGQITVMSAVSNPIDIIGSVTSPIAQDTPFPVIHVIVLSVLVLIMFVIFPNRNSEKASLKRFVALMFLLAFLALLVLTLLQYFNIVDLDFIKWFMSIGGGK